MFYDGINRWCKGNVGKGAVATQGRDSRRQARGKLVGQLRQVGRGTKARSWNSRIMTKGRPGPLQLGWERGQ